MDEINKRLDRILNSLQNSVSTTWEDETQTENHANMACNLTTDEIKAWLEREPSFTKRIVTPLDSSSTKRQVDVTLRNNIYKYLLL